MALRPRLPDNVRHLAWLDADSDQGREYWAAMQLMGRYASANHLVNILAAFHPRLVKMAPDEPRRKRR